MNILVLSDFHMDTRDPLGTFRWDEMDLIENIEKVRSLNNIDKIVFNGDMYELFKYSMDDVVEAYPVLMKYFKNKDFVFIKGNHDMINRKGRLFYRIVNSSGQKIHIEHGHNADWFHGSEFGRALARFGFSIIKRMSHSKSLMKIYFKINTYKDPVNQIPKRYNTIKYLTYALRLLKKYDMVILGHTHKLESHHTYYLYKKKRYLNSGTCSLGRFEGIVLDTETLRYELIKQENE